MGSKRKPFITAKAISEVIIRSGESCDWPSSHIQEIWQLASIHISEDVISASFDHLIGKPGWKSLLHRSSYKVTGTEARCFIRPSNNLSDPIGILSEKIRSLVKREWPWEVEESSHCEWNDFSAALLEALMKQRVASLRLKGKKLEQDLGM